MTGFLSTPWRAIAPFSMALFLATPAAALDLGALTSEERAMLRAEIRDFILENPEVLFEAVELYGERQEAISAAADAELIALNADRIFNDPDSWVGGNPDGDVTVVKFVDYNCGFCRRAAPEVSTLLAADPGIRLVMKEFPILGPDSELAARFALAVLHVEGPEAYEVVHHALLATEGPSGEAIGEILATIDFDAAAIRARMDAPETDRILRANHALAADMAISGTPAFVIGDRILRGLVPADDMAAVVAEARDALLAP